MTFPYDQARRMEQLAKHPGADAVFGAAHHGWRLERPWTEEQVSAFEKGHGGTLPLAYRRWLLEVASAGAGPGNGLFEPGTYDIGDGPKPWSRCFGPLSKPFPYTSAAPQHPGRLPGAMPIAEIGCATLLLLVVGGRQSGRIWVDDRANQCGLAPEGGLDFEAWISAWLDAAEREARDPWRPPKRHPNEPDRVRLASDVVDAERLEAWAREVRRALEGQGRLSVGQLGEFRRRGAAIHFDQSAALRAALGGEPVPEGGIAQELFESLLTCEPWEALEVPGLLRTWIAQRAPSQGRDYLGRPFQITAARRFLVVSVVA